jgi:hypothetical protein
MALAGSFGVFVVFITGTILVNTQGKQAKITA